MPSDSPCDPEVLDLGATPLDAGADTRGWRIERHYDVPGGGDSGGVGRVGLEPTTKGL
ncbi:MAG: hypothetical protein JWO67_136 [Streptosporangiaceae bacterium]|nr:hypothetical protein [Streptosporangiaceae bacterium]